MRLFFFLLSLCVLCEPLSAKSTILVHRNYNPNHYLIPERHPVKKFLDSIFAKTDAVLDKSHFEKAGFEILFFRARGSLYVARHPGAKGYIFKLHLEDSLDRNGKKTARLVRRVAVASHVRHTINHFHMHHIVCPHKWLYKVPETNPQVYILVTKDMELTSRKKSAKAWKTNVTRQTLEELYHILNSGYSSLALDQNIPYNKHGKFAIIDTEYDRRNFDLRRASRFLSPKMKGVWSHILWAHGYHFNRKHRG